MKLHHVVVTQLIHCELCISYIYLFHILTLCHWQVSHYGLTSIVVLENILLHITLSHDKTHDIIKNVIRCLMRYRDLLHPEVEIPTRYTSLANEQSDNDIVGTLSFQLQNKDCAQTHITLRTNISPFKARRASSHKGGLQHHITATHQ